MKNLDRVSSIVWMVFGGLFVAGALQKGLINKGLPGPGLLPFLTGVALMLLSLSVLLSALYSKEKAESGGFSAAQGSYKRLLIALGALVAFGFVMNFIGYLITSFIFMLFMTRLINPKGWRTPLIVALATAVLSYIFFVVYMEIQLPRGILIPRWLLKY
jgi:putative tricarboxylic transport membrane protein